MNVSYEGIGQWAATFACSGVSEGQAVKVSGNGTVAACAENGGFDGVVLSVARARQSLLRGHGRHGDGELQRHGPHGGLEHAGGGR